MARHEPYLSQYRRLRNFWGLILAVVWIVFWWLDETAAMRAAVATAGPCSGASCVSEWLGTRESSIEAGYYFGIFLAIITSPLTFIASHYYASWTVDKMQREDEAREKAEAQRQLEEDRTARAAFERQRQEELNRIAEQNKAAANAGQKASNRSEIVVRLGQIEAQLTLLEAGRSSDDRVMCLLQMTNITNELQAKFPLGMLVPLLKSEKDLGRKIGHVILRMRALNLQNEGFCVSLTHALQSSLT